MPFLHIFLESLAHLELTKTELDIGIVSEPYVDIAHCIRTGFCVSHALREWVRITIGFPNLESLVFTLDPTTIRYLGADERSILHIILRTQQSRRRAKTKIPYGVTISDTTLRNVLSKETTNDTLLLIPGKEPTWQPNLVKASKIAMYCPLYVSNSPDVASATNKALYQRNLPRDIAILQVVHALDSQEIVLQKD